MKTSGKAFLERRRQAKYSASIKFESMSDNEIAEALKKNTSGFLCSIEWKELRSKVIAHYGDKCMCCGFIPRDKRQVNVDHIKPRKLFPELSLVFDNLQVLCSRCNKKKGNKNMKDYRPSTLG